MIELYAEVYLLSYSGLHDTSAYILITFCFLPYACADISDKYFKNLVYIMPNSGMYRSKTWEKAYYETKAL